jgi:iron complex outermembrane receptor protein
MIKHPSKALYRAVLCAIATTQIAHVTAQEVEEGQAADTQLEEVLVTGSLIRGIEATGSQTISLDAEDIAQLGAITTNDILASIPQVSNMFNQRPEIDPRGADRLQVNRPNLRNLPGVTSATGATTLLLMDGHRMTPVGTDQSSPDADVIPQNVIRKVETVTDGGSSLYGADAVGGVINFVTIDEYEGVKINAGYDTGDDYDAWQTSVLAGTRWDSGSGYVSFATTHREDTKNVDRDWAAIGLWDDQGTTLSPDGTECVNPVGAVTTWFWFGSGWTNNPRAPGAGVRPVGDACDDNALDSLLPRQDRDNVFAGWTQELGDNMSLVTKAYYMDRTTKYSSYPLGGSVSEPSPTELGIVGQNVGDLYDTAQVGFSYAANPAYTDREMELEIKTWGIAPELRIDLGSTGWQSRNTLHYGKSDNTVDEPLSNRAKMVDYVNAGALDPENVAATDSAVIDDILNWRLLDDVDQEMFVARSIADGGVMELPAGTMSAAVGVEYTVDQAEKRNGETVRYGADTLQNRTEERDIKSAFGELSIPIIESLVLSLSARYDDYSDFGDTTNPAAGLTYEPVDWLTLTAKWGESFNAPTVLDSLAIATGRYVPNQAAVVPDPRGERTNPARDDAFISEGGSGSLGPQTADVHAFGFEVRPLEGLAFTLYYYEIDFKELLGAPDPTSSQAVLLQPEKFIFEPTQEEWEAFLATVENADQFADVDPAELGVIVDRTTDNTDEATLKGYDFGVSYWHDTNFGVFNYGLLGNYQSHFDLTQGGTATNQLRYSPDLTASTHVAWAWNQVSSRLTLNYTDNYDADPTVAVNQGNVGDFLVTNFVVGYDFPESSRYTDGLAVRLFVDNVFDEEPPQYRRQQQPNYNAAFSLGRVFKLGVSYEF